VVAAVFIAACALLALSPAAVAQSDLVWRVEPVTVVTTKGRYTFDAEIADAPELRARGLMFRTFLDDDKGMLFDFGKPTAISMWMKNTFIPLDMLFIGADGKIVSIARWTTPQSLDVVASAGDALAVLEVNGGTADRIRARPGDTVIHGIFSTQ
jgi:uncharacterized membrane protein (UPF0127 family)